MMNVVGVARLLLSAAALISLAACGGRLGAEAQRGVQGPDPSAAPTSDVQVVRDTGEGGAAPGAQCLRYAYVISHSSEEMSSTFKLFCGDRLAYAEEGEMFELLVPRDGGGATAENDVGEGIAAGVTAGKDITGDGVPDLVLVEHHYGTCCGPTYNVISLGGQVTQTATVEDYPRGAEWTFKDIDGNGIFEAVGYDSTYTRDEGMPTSFPALPVILTFRDGKYRLAESLMRKPAPGRAEFMKRVRELKLRSESEEGAGLASWRYMADLTYSGNGDLAKEFAYLINSDDPSNDTQPYWTKGKLEWVEFLTMLRESQYWDDLAAMNRFKDGEYADLECPY
jgi:hypothetical protein